MKYVMVFAGERGPALLEDGASRHSVAAECRVAALELVNGAARGFGKADLARWLTGPYARATRHAIHGERVRGMGQAPGLPFGTVEFLVERTRAELLESLRRAAVEGGALGLAEDARERGLVKRAHDEAGTEVWIPVDGARMGLLDRVTSLFAADYLNDPRAYEELFVCGRCEALVFDAGAKSIGLCAAHRRLSGIVAREEPVFVDDAERTG